MEKWYLKKRRKKKEVEYVAKNDEYIALRESESFM